MTSSAAQQYVSGAVRYGLILLGLVSVCALPVRAQSGGVEVGPSAQVSSIDALVRTLTQGSFNLVDDQGKSLGERRRGQARELVLSVADVSQRIRSSRPSSDQIAKLWLFFSHEDNASLLAVPVIESLVVAGNTPKGRAALWGELAYLMRALKGKSGRRMRSLLGFFERNRARFLPHLAKGRDTEIGGDELIDLMVSSRVFSSSFKDSLDWVARHNPAPVARRIEFERGRARPVHWEEAAFRAILAWKTARFSPTGDMRPKTLAEWDAVGETFTIIFNNLHEFRTSYRERMLRGLSAADAFNVVVGGEFELYRMGTSSYREYLHPLIMAGIREAGSFEAFMAHAAPSGLSDREAEKSGQRSMVFLRVVSTFALLEDVLETVHDRARFIEHALSSLGAPKAFRRNGLIVADLLTAPSRSASVADFKNMLIKTLYARFASERSARLRSVYGSMLSVYQMVTGDRRVTAIDRAYPLDRAMFHVAFDRLFSRGDGHGLIHRMFMRMDEDNDAVTTFAGFHAMMRSRGARIRDHGHHVLYRLSSGDRTVEIYVNKPTSLGITRGIAEIAKALHGKRVETAIGRGHTFIIVPFLRDARRILGDQAKKAAVVMIGSCGGEASMREVIDTFGYTSIVATRATGRQIINNAIIDRYINSLMSLKAGEDLFFKDVLQQAVSQFARPGGDDDLRNDARFYRLSMAAVLTAYLFDTHLRGRMEAAVR